MPKEERKGILILCVDRDDDVGRKTGISGPIIGRDENFRVASKLALTDPTEADANAIFGAVREYDILKKEVKDKEVNIATITGKVGSEYKADLELIRQMDQIVKDFKPDHIILISDGADDERVIPLLRSYANKVTTRRILIQQSRDLEDTYFLLKKYLDKLLTEQNLRVYFLGLPGIILLSAALLSIWGYEGYIWIAVVALIGIFFIVRGFGLTPYLSHLKASIGGKLSTFTFSIAGIILLVTVIYSYHTALIKAIEMSTTDIIIYTLKNTVKLSFLAVGVGFSGNILEFYIVKDKRLPERLFLLFLSLISLFMTYYILGFAEGSISIGTLSIVIALGTIVSMAIFLVYATTSGIKK